MNMAFSHTIIPMREFRKTVTRRYGWHKAKPAQIITAIEKGQGIPKGEHVVPICEIQLLTPRWERLDLMIQDRAYGEREVIAEGFPDMTPNEFVEMLCEMNKKRADELVHRLEFRFLMRDVILPIGHVDMPVIFPEVFEYQEDGTLAGWYKDYKYLEQSNFVFNTFRFEL